MTTNSTKYFCNRGALSARFILVDTPLRGEYYYDGEHGKYYFGARYFDPFFGMWMSPDPAAVFFREVYAPLKWRDFIEKDILQRLNGEAVLLKHSFRASAQFANPNTYGGDPLNYVDPNGEWAHIVVGAVIGGAIGVYSGYQQCKGSNDPDCGKKILFNGLMGAGVGAATAATGGAVSGMGVGAVGYVAESGTAGVLVGSAIEGSIIGAAGGAASYAGTGLVSMANNGSFDWNPRDLVSSMGYGAASGFVTGALVGAIGAVRYNISDEYAWGVDKQILEYSDELTSSGIGDQEARKKMARYVLNAENLDYQVEWAGEGGTSAGKGKVYINWDTGINEQGKFSASRFYSSIVHENGHIQDMKGLKSYLYQNTIEDKIKFAQKSARFQTCNNAMKEISAIEYELNHRYFKYWNDTWDYIYKRYDDNMRLIFSGY